MRLDLLTKLADGLERVPDDRFDLWFYGHNVSGDRMVEDECGSVGCALGWATTILRDDLGEGRLFLDRSLHADDKIVVFETGDVRWTGMQAAMKVFEISGSDATRLFMPGSYPLGYRNRENVIARVRELVSLET